MKGDTIPEQNHIARFCKPMQTDGDQILAPAFMLRTGENSLSVNCLEFLKCSGRESEARAKIAILNVGEVRKKVRTESPDGRNLEVLHDPFIDDISHCGIYNLKQDDELIAELILETINEIYSARK